MIAIDIVVIIFIVIIVVIVIIIIVVVVIVIIVVVVIIAVVVIIIFVVIIVVIVGTDVVDVTNLHGQSAMECIRWKLAVNIIILKTTLERYDHLKVGLYRELFVNFPTASRLKNTST